LPGVLYVSPTLSVSSLSSPFSASQTYPPYFVLLTFPSPSRNHYFPCPRTRPTSAFPILAHHHPGPFRSPFVPSFCRPPPAIIFLFSSSHSASPPLPPSRIFFPLPPPPPVTPQPLLLLPPPSSPLSLFPFRPRPRITSFAVLPPYASLIPTPIFRPLLIHLAPPILSTLSFPLVTIRRPLCSSSAFAHSWTNSLSLALSLCLPLVASIDPQCSLRIPLSFCPLSCQAVLFSFSSPLYFCI